MLEDTDVLNDDGSLRELLGAASGLLVLLSHGSMQSERQLKVIDFGMDVEKCRVTGDPFIVPVASPPLV